MSSSLPHSLADTAECLVYNGRLWRWTGGHSGAWFFISIDGETAKQIAGHALMRRLELGQARGFGSVRAMVRIGGSEWRTSVFPNGDGTWILPVKAAIRRAESLAEGDDIALELILL